MKTSTTDTNLTYQDFLFFAVDHNTAHAQDTLYNRVLYAQAYHETGGFTSSIYTQTSNMFGMRPSVSREKFYVDTLTTSTGKYAAYSSLLNSILDRIDLDENFNRNTVLNNKNDIVNYMQHVKDKGYATDPNYVSKWKAIYNKLFDENFGDSDNFSTDNGTLGTTQNPGSGIGFLSKIKFPFMLILGLIIGFFAIKKIKSMRNK